MLEVYSSEYSFMGICSYIFVARSSGCHQVTRPIWHKGHSFRKTGKDLIFMHLNDYVTLLVQTRSTPVHTWAHMGVECTMVNYCIS